VPAILLGEQRLLRLTSMLVNGPYLLVSTVLFGSSTVPW
jgi:hypothetical protein